MQFDYIIVGAGSAGCVLANRLSKDPDTAVLLLEAGGSDRKMEVRTPAAFSKLFRSDRDWDHNSEPEPTLKSRSMYLPRGKMLGGSSSMNAMIYIRGNSCDYDNWAKLGCDGWGYHEVLPYFRRSENNERIHDEYHGSGGELNVTDLRDPNPLSEMFVESAAATGHPVNRDFNGASQEGFGLYQVTQKKGGRWSAASAFLHSVRKRPNLMVETGALVHRVLFDGTRASGVQYSVNGDIHRAMVSGEVIVSAGAINSPQVLMLSGIGPAHHLLDHGIEPVIDSPHVGRNLQDHPAILQIWESNLPVSMADAEKPKQLLNYLLFKKGMLSSNVGEGGGFVTTRPGLSVPDIQFHMGPAYYDSHGFVEFDDHAFTIGPTLINIESRGTIELRSADPGDKPSIQGNYLSHDSEVAALIEGIRIGREIAHAGPFAAARGREIFPGEDMRTDAALEEFIRQRVELLYHPVGTCQMGRPDESVVDPQLKVHGIDGLRVVDASIMPVVPSGNTNAPTIMIAEKASDMILSDA